jgi:hypothetical protein
VLYALLYPYSLGVLLVTFVIGMTIRGWARVLISGARRPAWVSANTRRRRSTWFQPYLDAYGCVAALLGGIGWGAIVDTSDPRQRSRGRMVAQLLVGPLVLAGLGIGLLAAFRGWTHLALPAAPLLTTVTGTAYSTAHFHYAAFSGGSISFGKVALFLAGVELLAMGVLAIVPLPPMDGGKLLFFLAPRSPGWQKARYRLDEENWGIIALLVLALPIIFQRLILIALLSTIVDPLVRLVA